MTRQAVEGNLFSRHAVLLRYTLVGGASALLEFLVFMACLRWAGLPLIGANLVAIACAIVFGFGLQRRFTFNSTGDPRRQFMLFLLMAAIAVALNNALVYLFAAMLGLAPQIAKGLQIGIVFAWNYVFSRLVVFATRQPI